MERTPDKLFTEAFRLKDINKMALPKRVKETLRGGVENIGNVLLYSSAGGTGKSTITAILAMGHDSLFINASAERGIDTIREKIFNFCNTYSLDNSSKYKVIILEEMDGMTNDSFDALRAVIEASSDNVRFIGNCNNINKIPAPLRSRFTLVPLFAISNAENEELFNEYCKYIGNGVLRHKKIQIEYTDEDLRTFVKMYYPNMRSILNSIQVMYSHGCKKLDVSEITSTYDCQELFEHIFGNDGPEETYKLVMNNYSSDIEGAMTAISRDFLDYVYVSRPDYHTAMWFFATSIAKYMAQLPTALDKTIVLLALIYELRQIVINNRS